MKLFACMGILYSSAGSTAQDYLVVLIRCEEIASSCRVLDTQIFYYGSEVTMLRLWFLSKESESKPDGY